MQTASFGSSLFNMVAKQGLRGSRSSVCFGDSLFNLVLKRESGA